MFSVHRHEKIRNIFMRTPHRPVTHGFIMQLSHRQCHETQTFHILLETIYLNIITNRAKTGTNEQAHIYRTSLNGVAHTSGFTKFAIISSSLVESGGHNVVECGR